jgi:XTP/dITP diphosphohydrolase
MELVLATHNKGKVREMTAILSARFSNIDILTLDDFPDYAEPEEVGDSMAEIAKLKAELACFRTRRWCVADDGGLEVDALNGAPGLHSRRFLGMDTPFQEKAQRILELLKDTPIERRTARYRCAVALAIPSEETRIFEATYEGVIHDRALGEGGFGYDPIFWVTQHQCTVAQLSMEEKNKISHRSKALKELGDYLAERVS